MLNNKRKYFFIPSFIFLSFISKRNECFFNKTLLPCYLLNLTFSNDILFNF